MSIKWWWSFELLPFHNHTCYKLELSTDKRRKSYSFIGQRKSSVKHVSCRPGEDTSVISTHVSYAEESAVCVMAGEV